MRFAAVHQSAIGLLSELSALIVEHLKIAQYRE
jgi:hypothetical protein